MPLFDDSKTRSANKIHQLDSDFSKAMKKAFWDELKGFINRKSTRLLPFDEVKDKLEIWFVQDLGTQTVIVDSIVGSEGRYRGFTRRFLPLQEDLRDRWKKVDQAHYAHHDLPPVELYKVQDAYFVRDGHHRVSVARAKGVRNIEAHVYEYECDVPLDKETDLEKLGIQEAYHQFLKDTQLNKNRPHQGLRLTLLGGYP
ncbi:MAG: transcriptional regulator, partial [Proteobacteria bacterium]|nr:transcriptional regulator [Pseudomonadota bacterium]